MNLLEEELQSLKDQHLLRRLRTLKPGEGAAAELDGKRVLLFCGNDYLGFSRHPRVIEAAKQAADEYGVGAGASRLISGTTSIHTQLEEKIAQIKHKEKALVFSSGYLANLGILTALAGKEDVIILDKLCHASIVDGARLSGATIRVFPHLNYSRCEEILKQSQNFRRRLLVTESVFSMDGDLANFDQLTHLKKSYDAMLIVDDAHGLGVFDRTPTGMESGADIVMGTLSKAIGTLGGFAAASRETIDYLINRSRPFIFATALSPMICAAAKTAVELLETEPQWQRRLWQNVHAMRDILLRNGFGYGASQSAILPVMIGSEEEAVLLSERLLQTGIFVPAIRTPTVAKGKARLRVTLSVLHTPENLQAFESAIRNK